MQKITAFLTFDNQAEEAMNFYTSVFKNSKVVNVMRSGEAGPGSKRSFMAATLQLDGQELILLNGGPYFSFSQGISLFVSCETQAEIDELWESLSQGGEKLPCGWLKDRFGVSWQVIPPVLGEMLRDKDPKKAKRAMDAMLKMTKIDIKALKQAYEQRS